MNANLILGLISAGVAAWAFRAQIFGVLGSVKSAVGNLAATAAGDDDTPVLVVIPNEPTDDDLQAYWLALYKRLAKQGCTDGQKALTDLVLPHLTEHPSHPSPGPDVAPEAA